MAKKSPEAFRTISEVSESLDVPAHVLRFWESRFSQIKPIKRGGGRRYYRPQDINLIRGLQKLLHKDHMTIKGAQKVLRDNGVRFVADMGASQPKPTHDGFDADAVASVPAVEARIEVAKPASVPPVPVPPIPVAAAPPKVPAASAAPPLAPVDDAQPDLFGHVAPPRPAHRPFPPDPKASDPRKIALRSILTKMTRLRDAMKAQDV